MGGTETNPKAACLLYSFTRTNVYLGDVRALFFSFLGEGNILKWQMLCASRGSINSIEFKRCNRNSRVAVCLVDCLFVLSCVKLSSCLIALIVSTARHLGE